VSWSGELGFGVREPELGQTAPGPVEPEVDPADGHDHRHDRHTDAHGHPDDHGHGGGAPAH
jgi:hypothetical protein